MRPFASTKSSGTIRRTGEYKRGLSAPSRRCERRLNVKRLRPAVMAEVKDEVDDAAGVERTRGTEALLLDPPCVAAT